MKKLLYLNIITLLIAVNFISCKKDKDNTPKDYLPEITGGWRVIKAMDYFFSSDSSRYLHVYPDNTIAILSSGALGLRDMTAGLITVSDKQIVLQTGDNYPYSLFYNYTLKQDTLTITHLDSKSILVRDQSVPDTSAWVKRVSAVKIIKAPINDITDITYDGTFIWYGNAGTNNYLYKINPSTEVKDSINITLHADAVEYDGTNLWVGETNSALKKINQVTGATIFTSSDLDYYLNSIARNGNYLWCFSRGHYNIYKYNMSDNTFAVVAKNTASEIKGLTFANNYLYIVCNGKINKCKVDPQNNISTIAGFELYGYDIGGVTYDGTSFWVSASHEDASGNDYEIIKLSGVE